MELVQQVSVYVGELWENMLDFCNSYANVAAMISLLIGLLGFFGIKKLVRKQKEKKKYYKMFIAPVKNRSTSEQMDAYIDSTYNGASDLEVIDEE